MFRKIEKCVWHVKNRNHYVEANTKCHPVKRRNFIQKETSRILGESTIGATIKIIEYFKPDVWVIENPLTSKIWSFQKEHWNFDKFYLNKTYYSSYDKRFSRKPTIFKSNIKLVLHTKIVNGNNRHMANGNYLLRSKIPSKLVTDVINQIIKWFNVYGKKS